MSRPTSTARDDDRAHAIERILSSLPAEEHDRLRPLLREGPALVERLTGSRPHRACLWRWWRDGTHGVRLEAVAAGRTLLVSPRMLAAHLVAVAAARRQRDAERRAAPVKPLTLRGGVKVAPDTERSRRTQATLLRHRLAQEARR